MEVPGGSTSPNPDQVDKLAAALSAVAFKDVEANETPKEVADGRVLGEDHAGSRTPSPKEQVTTKISSHTIVNQDVLRRIGVQTSSPSSYKSTMLVAAAPPPGFGTFGGPATLPVPQIPILPPAATTLRTTDLTPLILPSGPRAVPMPEISPVASSVGTFTATSPAFTATSPAFTATSPAFSATTSVSTAATPNLRASQIYSGIPSLTAASEAYQQHHRRLSSGAKSFAESILSTVSTTTAASDMAQQTAEAQQLQQKHSLYKTELCRGWEETGRCRYGAKCQFAHGPSELRPVVRHHKYKTEICRTWMEQGSCPYGRRCVFIHGDDKIGSAQVQGLSATGVTWTPPGQKPADVLVPAGAIGQLPPRNDVEGVTRMLGRDLLSEVMNISGAAAVITTPLPSVANAVVQSPSAMAEAGVPTGRVFFGNREVAPRVRSSALAARKPTPFPSMNATRADSTDWRRVTPPSPMLDTSSMMRQRAFSDLSSSNTSPAIAGIHYRQQRSSSMEIVRGADNSGFSHPVDIAHTAATLGMLRQHGRAPPFSSGDRIQEEPSDTNRGAGSNGMYQRLAAFRHFS